MGQVQPLTDEITLIDILQILWKRKVLIIAITFMLTVSSVFVSMQLPEIYLVTTSILPAKRSDGGLIVDLKSIQQNILGGTYNQEIQNNLGLKGGRFPELKVQIHEGVSLLEISLLSDNPLVAVDILNELVALVSRKIQANLVDAKASALDEIKLVETRHRFNFERIQLLKNQIHETSLNMQTLKNEQQNALVEKLDNDISIFRYQSVILNQRVHLDNLQLKLQEVEMLFSLEVISVEKIIREMAEFEDTKVIRLPTVPETPIKPKKLLIVSFALIIGLMGSAMSAFLLEYISRVRK